jgi:hypothetical protein
VLLKLSWQTGPVVPDITECKITLLRDKFIGNRLKFCIDSLNDYLTQVHIKILNPREQAVCQFCCRLHR